MKLYMFRTVRLSTIRSLFNVHSAMVRVYVIQVCRQLSSRSICSCSKAVYKPVWHIQLQRKSQVVFNAPSYSQNTVTATPKLRTAILHLPPRITDVCKARSGLKIQTHFNYPCIIAQLWLRIESFVAHFALLYTTLWTAESRLSPATAVVSFFVSLPIRQFYTFKTEKSPTYLHRAHPKELSVALRSFSVIFSERPRYCQILFLIAFLEGNFIRNIIIILCTNYNVHVSLVRSIEELLE